MARIIIADDHAVVRKGIKEILSHEKNFFVVGEARNAQEVFELIEKHKPDLLILDINMPGKSGLEILSDVKIRFPGTPVLILSIYPESQFAKRFLKAGAAGYINKDMEPEEFVKAIKTVLSGSKYISTSLAEKFFLESSLQNSKRALYETLSDREFEVFRLLVENKTISKIAEILSLSVKTISTYKSRIFTKLHLKNIDELKRYADDYKLFRY